MNFLNGLTTSWERLVLPFSLSSVTLFLFSLPEISKFIISHRNARKRRGKIEKETN